MPAKAAKGGWHQLGMPLGRKCQQKPQKVGGTNWECQQKAQKGGGTYWECPQKPQKVGGTNWECQQKAQKVGGTNSEWCLARKLLRAPVGPTAGKGEIGDAAARLHALQHR